MKLLYKIRSGLYWLWRLVFPQRGRIVEGKATMVAEVKKLGHARGERHYLLHTGKRQTRKQRKTRWQHLLHWRTKCQYFLRNRSARRVEGKIILAFNDGAEQEILDLMVIAPGCPVERLGTIYIDDKPITIDDDGFGTGIFTERVSITLDRCKWEPWDGDALVGLRLIYDPGVSSLKPCRGGLVSMYSAKVKQPHSIHTVILRRNGYCLNSAPATRCLMGRILEFANYSRLIQRPHKKPETTMSKRLTKYKVGDYVLVRYGGPDFCRTGHGQQLARLTKRIKHKGNPSIVLWDGIKYLRNTRRWTMPVVIHDTDIIDKAPSSFLPPILRREFSDLRRARRAHKKTR